MLFYGALGFGIIIASGCLGILLGKFCSYQDKPDYSKGWDKKQIWDP